MSSLPSFRSPSPFKQRLRLTVWTLTAVLAASTLAATSEAQESGFRLPNLNPFKTNRSSQPALQPVNRSKSWLPKLPTWGGQGGSRRSSSTPGVWQRVNSGTKAFFTSAQTALTPWNKPKSRSSMPQVTGARRNYSGSPNRSSKKSSGGSFWPWSQPQEPKPVTSVNDFLRLPSPGSE